jgi:uncharacterized cupredoxin-like copper-binding protein
MLLQRIARIPCLIAAALGACPALSIAGQASAHGPGGHASAPATKPAPAGQTTFGIAGNPTKVSRTIDVDALDTFRYSPDRLEVRRGETVRFVVHNKGNLQHELVIGTMQELQRHAELMQQSPEMEHEAPHMVHVAPGKASEIVWQFNRAGTFKFACLIAGHFEAGMVGTIAVVRAARPAK